MNHRFFTRLALAVAGSALLIPAASLFREDAAIAVEFTFTTVQERATGEVVEQDDIIENFRQLQRERLSGQEATAIDDTGNEQEASAELETGQAAELEAVKPVSEDE